MPNEDLTLLTLKDISAVYSQRELSEKVGCSVGTVNKVLKSLIKGEYIYLEGILVKNKIKNKYSLTKKGEEHKYELTEKLLDKKRRELETLEKEYQNEKR